MRAEQHKHHGHEGHAGRNEPEDPRAQLDCTGSGAPPYRAATRSM
jgi:hypothetical protein